MSVPERVWIAGMLDECGNYYSEPVEAEGECGGIAVEYIRADLVDPAAIREAALREAADAINERGKMEQADFGLNRATQNFFRARDLVRALIDKGAG